MQNLFINIREATEKDLPAIMERLMFSFWSLERRKHSL